MNTKKKILVIIIILAIVGIILVSTGTIQIGHKVYGLYEMDANADLVDASVTMTDYTPSTESKFIPETKIAENEKGDLYEGHYAPGEAARSIYSMTFKVNLSDVEWNYTDGKNPLDGNELDNAQAYTDENLTSILKNKSTLHVKYYDYTEPTDTDKDKNDVNLKKDQIPVENVDINGDMLTFTTKWACNNFIKSGEDMNVTIEASEKINDDIIVRFYIHGVIPADKIITSNPEENT